MRENQRHFPVNWVDGMKVNKNHFIQQDDAWKDALQEMASLPLSPLRYGVLPPSPEGEDTFNVKISYDNQDAIRVSVLSCHAITSGGVRISLPAPSPVGQAATGNVLTELFPVSSEKNESPWWIFLFVHPFEKQAAGSPDLSENPPRFPIVLPTYSLQFISESNYRQVAGHPYALPVGKIYVNGKDVKIEHEYIPPCISIHAHPDLISLHSELDKYLANIELYCSRIVQKIFVKKQQNDISELVMFLCDRMILHLGQAITAMRWSVVYDPPVTMFAAISALARVMKNTIDLRTGSGKEELMNYLIEWCELRQGELESLLMSVSNSSFDHNDVNSSIHKVVMFVKVTSKLFEALTRLEFIGKRKESGIFVKEESPVQQSQDQKARRRFFDR